mgnify:CR=1 FL=1|tara:strand:+ start:1419 stop:1934 length:516 start_codon:yes stop_codon:yes gene_type:complete
MILSIKSFGVKGVKARLNKLKKVGGKQGLKKATDAIAVAIFDYIDARFDNEGPGWKGRSAEYIRTGIFGATIGVGRTRRLSNIPFKPKGSRNWKVKMSVGGGIANLSIDTNLDYAESFNFGQSNFIPHYKSDAKIPFRTPARRFMPLQKEAEGIVKQTFDSIIAASVKGRT